MKRRIAQPHPAEVRNRRAKADALVEEINRMTDKFGITKSAMLNSVALWPPLWWAQCSLQIGKEPPHDDTILAVLAVLSRAALIERLAGGEPYFSSDRDAREVRT